MADLLADLKSIITESLQSKTISSCSRWAHIRRIMGGDFSGPYGFKYHPWCREPHDSRGSWNVAMKAAQMGLTEVGINRAFYILDVLKRDVLYVLPTALNASDFSKARFSPALRLSPYLASIFTDTNTVNLKQAGATNLYIRGSRGDSNLKSIPVSELILDEVDEMDQKAVWLALERLSGQLRKCVWAISTPTIPNYGVHKLYQTTTQEHFMFKCPLCGRWTELVWPDCIEIIGEAIYDKRCHESYLKCKECQGKLEHKDKPDWLSTGRWVVTDKNSDPDRRGFNINQMYSFTVSPGELVIAHFRGLGDEAAATEFANSKLGQPFLGETAQVTDEKIDACIANHTTSDARPKTGGQRLITMGIDQGKWCYVEVCEWIMEEMSRDLNTAASCKTLWMGKFHEEDAWNQFDQLMIEWQVIHCIIDADPAPYLARQFARRFPGYVTLSRFRKGVMQREINVTKDDNKADMAIVDRTNWLDCALGRFHTNRIALPVDTPLEYRDHMKNLVRTYERDENNNPIAKYVSTGPDHYGFARCYAEIALPFAASYVRGQDIKAFL